MAERNSALPDNKAREIPILLLVIPSLQAAHPSFSTPWQQERSAILQQGGIQSQGCNSRGWEEQQCFTLFLFAPRVPPLLPDILLEAGMWEGALKGRSCSELLLPWDHGLVSLFSPFAESAKPGPRSHS